MRLKSASRFRVTPRYVFSKLRQYSFYQKNKLFRNFRFPLYTRYQANNLFLNTLDCFEMSAAKISAGMLTDYQAKKKKKKTYMLGFELSFFFGERLIEQGVEDLHFFCKGRGAQKRGVYLSLIRQGFTISKFIDTTPLAHNGTRPCGRRRL